VAQSGESNCDKDRDNRSACSGDGQPTSKPDCEDMLIEAAPV
jgi:hypothetical protein